MQRNKKKKRKFLKCVMKVVFVLAEENLAFIEKMRDLSMEEYLEETF